MMYNLLMVFRVLNADGRGFFIYDDNLASVIGLMEVISHAS